MQWIELVIIRAVDGRQKQAVRRLINQLAADRQPDGLRSITLYRNAFVETDMCIHLQWKMKDREPAKSDLGIELAASFEEFGRVHHTIWIVEGVEKSHAKTE